MGYGLTRTEEKFARFIDDMNHILKEVEDGGFNIDKIMEAVDGFIEENSY